jgi:hypothetical protein
MNHRCQSGRGRGRGTAVRRTALEDGTGQQALAEGCRHPADGGRIIDPMRGWLIITSVLREYFGQQEGWPWRPVPRLGSFPLS